MAPAAERRPRAGRETVKAMSALASRAMGPAAAPMPGPPKARISKKGRRHRKVQASAAPAFPEPGRPLQTSRDRPRSALLLPSRTDAPRRRSGPSPELTDGQAPMPRCLSLCTAGVPPYSIKVSMPPSRQHSGQRRRASIPFRRETEIGEPALAAAHLGYQDHLVVGQREVKNVDIFR